MVLEPTRSHLAPSDPPPDASLEPGDERLPRMLARQFYQELMSQGFTPDQVLAFASELIEQVTVELDPARG